MLLSVMSAELLNKLDEGMVPRKLIDTYNEEHTAKLSPDQLLKAVDTLHNQTKHILDPTRPVNEWMVICMTVVLSYCQHLKLTKRTVGSLSQKLKYFRNTVSPTDMERRLLEFYQSTATVATATVELDLTA
jgi:hypothetical protein